jgi:hypothetical protein
MLEQIRAQGWPAAVVAQDGMLPGWNRWDEIDALFIGGSTEWKLSGTAARIVFEALDHGKHVHMGRVNSRRRATYAEWLGCHSADGTFLAFAPDKNLVRQTAWSAQGVVNMSPHDDTLDTKRVTPQ